MVILETSIFTKTINALMQDDEYQSLQNHLLQFPNTGDLIQGSGGIRKIRWRIEGRGKRGGIRVIYYWANKYDQLLMLYAYPKNEQENLTKDQLSILKKVVESEFKR
jgi:hypothetical protein